MSGEHCSNCGDFINHDEAAYYDQDHNVVCEVCVLYLDLLGPEEDIEVELNPNSNRNNELEPEEQEEEKD